MNNPADKSDILDLAHDPVLLMYLGLVTMHWSTVEAQVSAALFSKLNLDDIEFTLLLGRLEVLPKLQKLNRILVHRKEEKLATIASSISKRVENLRPDRNALTHGVYQGKSGRGEYAFIITADLLFDEGERPSKVMRVFTSETLAKHVDQVTELISEIQSAFDSPKLRKLHDGSFRVPKKFRVSPPKANPEEKR
jgi:hypothetical protein